MINGVPIEDSKFFVCLIFLFCGSGSYIPGDKSALWPLYSALLFL